MAHKNKRYEDSDNSRQAFKYRMRHGTLTKFDLERIAEKERVRHNSKVEALLQSGQIVTKVKRGGTKQFNWKK